jgi:hypothetical protein
MSTRRYSEVSATDMKIIGFAIVEGVALMIAGHEKGGNAW